MHRSIFGHAGWLTGRTVLILAVPTVVWAGSMAQQAGASAESLIQAAREEMVGARYCFLITLDDLGQPQARLMDAFEPEADMTVWMATDARTRKVRQLRHDPRATLAYYAGGGNGYVTLIGRVRLVDDAEERQQRWKSGWEAFYADGPTDDAYLLLKFTPMRIELMNISRGIGDGPFSPVILVRQEADWIVRERIDSR
jgi:general stress protein 26